MRNKKNIIVLILLVASNILAQSKVCSSSLNDNIVDLNTIGKCAIKKFKESNKEEYLTISSRKKRYVRRKPNNYIQNVRNNIKSHSDSKSTLYTMDNVDRIPIFSSCRSILLGSRESQLNCFKSEIRSYIDNNLNYPQKALSEGIEDRVLASFVINENGFVKDVKVKSVKKVSVLENEAKRVLNNLPQLKPAKHNDKEAEVKYTLYVDFKLANKKNVKADKEEVKIQGDNYIKDFVSFEEVKDKPIFITCLDEKGTDVRQECIKETIRSSILENLTYPFDAAAEGIQGRVWVRFIVDKQGYLTNVTTSGPKNGVLLEKEAERLVKLLPKFLPGKKNGEYVNIEYFMPFDFHLEE